MITDLTFSDQQALLTLSGAFDQHSITSDFWSSASKEQLIKLNECAELNIDLNQLERADTAGLAWLINIARDAHKQNIKVIFTHVPDKLLNLADLSGAKAILQA